MKWHTIENLPEVPSPALLIFPDRVRENLRRMLQIAGKAQSLRPHVKTHKMPQIVDLKLKMDITKFKCATLAEAAMIARCGGKDILVAMQPVGPNVNGMITLIRRFPHARFMTIVDHEGVVVELSRAAAADGVNIDILIDIDCGMHRTGIAPDSTAIELYRRIDRLPGLTAAGIHAYDGHILDSDVEKRKERFATDLAPVRAFRQNLQQLGLPVLHRVFGGTPTFPLHAADTGRTLECSPGTCVFWDFAYGDAFPDLDFLHAALVLTRVVSKPAADLLCLDLGHKAVSPDKPQPRVKLIGCDEIQVVVQGEEHLLIRVPDAARFDVGHAFLGIPRHVCSTVSLYDRAIAVHNHHAEDEWAVTARDRRVSV